MTKRKNNKKALIVSALSLLLCVSMLVGSTMAWFTDTATTAVNTIESGTLDIDLVDEDGKSLEGKTLTFLNKNGEADILFEPNATFRTNKFKIQNNGSLAAKYQITINTEGIDSKLLEVITLNLVKEDGTAVDMAGQTEDFTQTITISYGSDGRPVYTTTPFATKDFMYIEAHMDQNAGNDYQGLTMEGISITVKATQDTVEYDSENNTYDENATYDNVVVVATQDQLNAAIANTPVDTPVVISLADGTYTLPTISSAQAPTSKNITFEGSEDAVIEFTNAVTMADCTIAFDGVKVTFPASANYIGLQHTAKVVYKDCVIEGQQTMYAPEVAFNNCTFVNTNNAYCVWTYGATNANFSNCTFTTGGKAILVYTESETHATIGLDKCIFNDNDYVNTKKGAVEIGSSPYSADTTYNIYMNGCTVNGFAVNDEGISTGSAFWGNKNSMDKDHLNVVIDGVDVY